MSSVWNMNLPDNVELDYVYMDTDVYGNEMAELYSYTEESEFQLNVTAFEDLSEDYGLPLKWSDMTSDQKCRCLDLYFDGIELSNKTNRMKSIRAVLYLCQGNFGECLTLEDQVNNTRENIFLLYEKGFFNLFIQLLHMEIDAGLNSIPAIRRPAVSLNDSTDLRVLISVLYTFIITMGAPYDNYSENQTKLRQQFVDELSQPCNASNELLSVTLFQMTTKFCNGAAPHFPIKRVLLLLWKVLSYSLGGIDVLNELKNSYRINCGLNPVPDDTIQVTKSMRAASPPASAAEMLEAQQQRKMNRPFKRQMVVKQNSLSGEESLSSSYQDIDGQNGESNGLDDEMILNDTDRDIRSNSTAEEKMDMGPRPSSPRPSTPTANVPPTGDLPCQHLPI